MPVAATLWNALRAHLWVFAAGVALAGALLLFGGATLLWLGLAVVLAAAVIARLIAPLAMAKPRRAQQAGQDADALPPLTRLVLEQLPAPVMLLDDAARVLFANAAMREVLGPGLERKPISAVLRNPAVLEVVAQTMGDDSPGTVQFILPVPIERHYQAYTARVGTAPGITALLLHDLTAIKRAEQMRADFVANASHELRTPLAAVSGFIDTLRGHARNDEAARDQFLDIMSVEAARMRRLIDDLLSLTRIEMNEHVRPDGCIALDGLVREAAAALAPLAAADNITVEVSVAKALPPVTGDRDQLIQLFQNLIHNAIKYGRPGGHVWIGIALTPERQLSVTVRDDGEGIAQTALPRLTERFYRVDVKRSRERGGTGLGLAIVKHIVSRHQGRLSIESKPGEGSAFTVTLPAAAAKDQKAPETGASHAVTEVL